MQALEWAFYGDFVRGIVPIGVGGRHSAWCIGWSESQRQAIYADPRWQEGRYDPGDPPSAGLATARMIAMITYRSFGSFQTRFGRNTLEEDDAVFRVESYLQYQGEKLVQRFDANCYIHLTKQMDSHDVARGRGAYVDVLRQIEQHALVLAIDDLQWSDAESQAVLTAVARPHAVRSVLVLATVRTDTGVEAGRHLELCPPGASTIELGSLPRSAVDALPMTRAWEETGGHPWLLAACVEADRLDGHLGAAVIAGVLEWVGSPGSAVRLVLGSAASIGSRFRVDELSALVGVSPATTLEILEDPERRQLVARVGSAERPREQEFAFCADLARRVLSASVARSQVPA
jgi:hypothetical protein